MHRARLLVLAAVLSMWPSTAHAGFWAWLEELSGPGPFRGDVISFTVGCVRTDNFNGCPPGDRHITRTFVVRIAWFRSDDDKPRFKDLPAQDADNRGKVSVIPVTGLYLFRLHDALDIGPGVGFMRVSGRGFSSFYRLMLTPVSASFTPFALREEWRTSPWSHVVRFELDTSFIPQGFRGKDFNNTRTSFDSGPEFLTRATTVIDLSAFGGAMRSILRR